MHSGDDVRLLAAVSHRTASPLDSVVLRLGCRNRIGLLNAPKSEVLRVGRTVSCTIPQHFAFQPKLQQPY